MTKRNLFAEMTKGFDALAAARKGKKTLRTSEVVIKPAVDVSVQEQYVPSPTPKSRW
jgi:putative transcriptional regulator